MRDNYQLHLVGSLERQAARLVFKGQCVAIIPAKIMWDTLAEGYASTIVRFSRGRERSWVKFYLLQYRTGIASLRWKYSHHSVKIHCNGQDVKRPINNFHTHNFHERGGGNVFMWYPFIATFNA